jgi:hypothetical protein
MHRRVLRLDPSLTALPAVAATLLACGATNRGTVEPVPGTSAAAPPAATSAPEPPALGRGPLVQEPGPDENAPQPPPAERARLAAKAPPCSPADWSPRALPPLLETGKRARKSESDLRGAWQLLFDSECTDSPQGPSVASPTQIVVDGVAIHVATMPGAGKSRRGWAGAQCTFEMKLADGSGPVVTLGSREIPPFTTVSAIVRSGSAVWLSVTFNGYTREFPRGGNRIVAVDLCEGRVVWTSKDSTSNGGLLLLGDYLLSPYGFTNEPRFVFVLDARSGAVVQKLPVVENVCPSTSWAPHWHPGERCDAPGQRVGAATNPRVEGGLFLVDTNTGSSSFQFK